MLKYFIDDTEFGGPVSSTCILGGIVVDDSNELAMINAIQTSKERKLGDKTLPIKYNLKDLRKCYEKQGKLEVYNKLLSDYNNFRRELLTSLSGIDYKIVVSCIRAFRTDKDFILKHKEKLRRFVFVMCLTRFSLEVKLGKHGLANIICDTPPNWDTHIFNEEYASAYMTGKSIHGITYKAGTLNEINFVDYLSYSCSLYNSILQIADIYVGAVKDLIKGSLNENGNSIGIEIIKDNINKFRGYPDKILNYGLVFDSGEGTKKLKDLTQDKITELLQ